MKVLFLLMAIVVLSLTAANAQNINLTPAQKVNAYLAALQTNNEDVIRVTWQVIHESEEAQQYMKNNLPTGDYFYRAKAIVYDIEVLNKEYASEFDAAEQVDQQLVVQQEELNTKKKEISDEMRAAQEKITDNRAISFENSNSNLLPNSIEEGESNQARVLAGPNQDQLDNRTRALGAPNQGAVSNNVIMEERRKAMTGEQKGLSGSQ